MGRMFRIAAPLLLLTVVLALLVTSLGASCNLSSLSWANPHP